MLTSRDTVEVKKNPLCTTLLNSSVIFYDKAIKTSQALFLLPFDLRWKKLIVRVKELQYSKGVIKFLIVESPFSFFGNNPNWALHFDSRINMQDTKPCFTFLFEFEVNERVRVRLEREHPSQVELLVRLWLKFRNKVSLPEGIITTLFFLIKVVIIFIFKSNLFKPFSPTRNNPSLTLILDSRIKVQDTYFYFIFNQNL